MGLKGKLDKLQKALRGDLASFELSDGQRFYFDPQKSFGDTFKFFTDSMRADWRREPRPEPPELLKAVANARNRADALERVMGGASHLPVDRTALVEHGVFKPRSLVAGHSYEDLGISVDGG